MHAFTRVLPLILLVAVASAQPEPPLKLVQTFPLPGVEGRFDHFAVDLKGQRLFLAALGNNTVEVLDLAAGKVARPVTGLREPQGIAFAPDSGALRARVYVGCGEGANCTILDGNTLATLHVVPGLPDADNVRYEGAARQVYVGYGEGALAILDAESGKRLGEVRVQGHPESFRLAASGGRIYVNAPRARQVAVIDRARRAVVAAWPLSGAEANFPMALDEAHARLYVGCRRPARLLVFDTATGQQTASVEIVGDTDDLFYDSARDRIYVVGGEGAITVLERRDGDRYERLAQVPTAAGARTGFFVPELRRLFVAVPHRGKQGAEVRVYEPR